MNDESPRHIIQVDANISTACQYCDFYIDGNRFPEGANHYIQQHGMRVLAAGQQTARDYDGHPYTYPFVLLGSDEVPPEREPLSITIAGVTPGAR